MTENTVETPEEPAVDAVEAPTEVVAEEPAVDAEPTPLEKLSEEAIKFIIAARLAGVDAVEFIQNKLAEIAD